MTEDAEPVVDPGWCKCRSAEVDQLVDLINAGFSQHEASRMLWRWCRSEVSRRLEGNGSL